VALQRIIVVALGLCRPTPRSLENKRAPALCVTPRASKLTGDFIGRDLDYDLLSRLPAAVDPCGENGEFHTFAYAGPMFFQSIPIQDGEIVTRNGFLFADVLAETELANSRT